MSAVLVCNAAEFVDSCDEGADEAEIDEGDKKPVFA